MKADKHYWKVTFCVLTSHIGGFTKIRVQKQHLSYWKEILFEGTLLELDKNRSLKDMLEFELVGTIMTEGDTLIIGVNM
jgi:hypothetical protein